jgi:tetratricopeptide (TPR) repeat protein
VTTAIRARRMLAVAAVAAASVIARPARAQTSGANATHDPSRLVESDGKFYFCSTGGGCASSTDGLAWKTTGLKIAATHHNLGGVYMKLGDLHKAQASFNLALSIKAEIFGENHAQIGLTLYNLACVHDMRGDAETAARTKARAIELLGGDPLADHPSRRG